MISKFRSLKDELRQCKRCKSLVKSRKTVVLGYGDTNAKIMFLGLVPGRNGADITGVPFTKDPSGVLFQEAMIRAGYSLESDPTVEKPRLKNVYVTNIVKCNAKDDAGNNRQPSKDEINTCLRYFEIEKNLINPIVIVTLGKTPTEYLLNTKINRFIEYHNVLKIKEGITYIPFLHPGYVIRGAYSREKYLQEIMSFSDRVKF